jgi:MerR family transcriptional regulator/heat shock protein HspR
MDDNLPVYIISSAADLLGVHPRTLHLYEEKGLLVSTRKGNRRFYSANDLQWIHAIRYLVHERGLNLEGLRRLLALRAQLAYQDVQERPAECEDWVGRTVPCWEKGATSFECYRCPVYTTTRDGLREDEGVPRLSL